MKQVLQNLRSGQTELADIPCPQVRRGHLLIQTTRSLISAGTERMLVEFGRASLIAKARQQPDKVRQVLDKIKTDGLMPTLETVFSRLDEPLPLGYCNVGRVVEVGEGVSGYDVGDRVASNGPHAEMVCVPTTLCARVPDNVPDEHACFTVLSSVALQGIRLIEPTFGERIVVTGLGLLGMIAIQLLRAHGCKVLGVDISAERCRLAESLGFQTVCVGEGGDPVKAAEVFAEGKGVDGVLITAATKSDEPMRQAAQMCRKCGRIVSTGNTGMNLDRPLLYEKELRVQVSCSYGPGRYDPKYEDQSQDYPLPYVRWTEGRNLEAVLDAMSAGTLNVQPLISRQIAHADAANAYDAIIKDSGVLGVVLAYPEQAAPLARVIPLKSADQATKATKASVAMVGAGNFAKLILLPAIQAAGARLKSVVSGKGVTALHAGKKFEADEAGSDLAQALADPEINTVFIATRHNAHASMVVQALEAGKHVFVEKPLAIDEEGLARVRAAYAAHPEQQLMVGSNRRFAPHTVKIRELLSGRSQPLAVEMMVNAGHLPPDHWQIDPLVGGGRIVSEGCHFVDLLMHIVGYPITSVQAVMFGGDRQLGEDKMTIIMNYADGSIGTVHYWSNGPKSYPKERVEIFSEGRVIQIDNWRRLRSWGWKGAPNMRQRQDKGHKAEVAAFLDRVEAGGPPLIPFDSLDLVTRVTFAAVKSAREGLTIPMSATVDPDSGTEPTDAPSEAATA